MATPVSPSADSDVGLIEPHILPVIALFSLNPPAAQEASGSVSEGSGPTTGQISPRF